MQTILNYMHWGKMCSTLELEEGNWITLYPGKYDTILL
jgi:hypothetical protein